jgi:KGK domain
MKDHSYLQDFDEEDLISFENKEKIFRISKLNDNCRKSIENNGESAQGFHATLSRSIISSQQWMSQGVECEILKLGEKQWGKGRIKVRVIVEFEPDEEVKPLSELDAFRDEEAWPPGE